MRVRIIFLLKNRGASVPFHHQFLLAQMVKGLLVKGRDPRFVHYEFYNFSGLKGQTKISRNGLNFYSSRVTLVFSAPEKEFIDYFLKHLFSFPQIELGNLILVPEMVEQEFMPTISEENKFICISPVVLLEPSIFDNQGKRFISPETETFSDQLYDSTMQRLEKLGSHDSDKMSSFYKFQIVPDQGYLNRIKETQKKFARIYPVYDMDVKYEIRGYTFPFTMYAAKEVQEFSFMCGLGKYTYKGFGMLDVANADPGERSEVYEFERL